MIAPDTNYPISVFTLTRPGVTAGDDGAMVSMTRDHLGAMTGLVANLRLVLTFADGTEITNSAEIFGGDVIRRDGTVETKSTLQATWPGEWQNGQRQPVRPNSLRLELNVVQPLRCALEVDAIRLSTNTTNQVQH